MGLLDRAGAIALTHLEPDSEEVLMYKPRPQLTGWDGADLELLVFYADGTTDEKVVLLDYAPGYKLSTAIAGTGVNMWIVDTDPVPTRAPGIWRVRCQCRGLIANTDPPRYKITIGAHADGQSVENVLINGIRRDRAEVDEHAPDMRVEWVHIGTRPSILTVGDKATPPDAPTVRDTFWDFLTDPVYHWPNEWKHSDRSIEQLIPDVDAYLVRDLYEYVYEESP
jgi:hypothetical protein